MHADHRNTTVVLRARSAWKKSFIEINEIVLLKKKKKKNISKDFFAK